MRKSQIRWMTAALVSAGILLAASVLLAGSKVDKGAASQLVQITKGEEIELYPSAAKTDNRIAFESWKKDAKSGDWVSRLIVMEPDGTMKKLLGGDESANNPEWGMEDNVIMFDAIPQKKRLVWAKALDKVGNQLVSLEETVDFDPSTNPKNGQVAYAGLKKGKDIDVRRDGLRWIKEFKSDMPSIWVVSANRSGNKLVTEGLNPAWSPDGTRIAYASNTTGNYEIYTRRPELDNPALVPVTKHPKGKGMAIEPTWSPDGRKIAYAAKVDDNWDIWMSNADGTEPVRLTTDPAHDGGPSWAKDGFIYFHSERAGSWDIWKLKPAGYEPIPEDKDHDGIPDIRDKCPDQPEDFDGFEDEDGCPDPDNDKDGIPDALDKCPNEPETINGFQDEDGCPDVNPLKDPAVLYLEFDKAQKILPASYAQLDPVREKIGQITNRLEVRSYIGISSKSKGKPRSEDMNLKDTQSRADAVKAYLVEMGVKEDRLVARGYGTMSPIGDNETPEGRAQNSRVEIVLISDK